MAGRMAARRLSLPTLDGDLIAWRRRLIVTGVLVLMLAAVYLFWFRDSSLVAVEQVKVEGVTANEEEITAALESVGLEQSTLHVDDAELAEAVAGFPTVASIRADASIPHELTIVVTERRPVAAAKVEGQRVAVSADGYVLPGVSASDELPALEAAGAPGGRLDEDGIAQAEILGAAPEALRKSLVGASWDEEEDGVVVELEGAPELRFGDGSDPEDKWRAVAVVLADPEANVSSYVDVSIPERTVSD